jgi:cellulose biosynthesis protein BcsQ
MPVSPQGQGQLGLGVTADYIGDMPCAVRPALLGVVGNLFDCRDRASGLFYEYLHAEWKGKLFETIIHRDHVIESSGVQHLPVCSLTPHSAAATIYEQLAGEVLTNIAMADDVRKASPGWT